MNWEGTTLVLNAQPDVSVRITPSVSEGNLFISNGIYYDKMDIIGPTIVYSHSGIDEIVYDSSGATGSFVGWRSEIYQTVTFVIAPDFDKAAFETWLSDNSVPYEQMQSSFIVTVDDLTGIANAIRDKTGDGSELVFPTGFVNAIGELSTLEHETADATATASDIKVGKTAYVQGIKIYGTYALNIANVRTNVIKAHMFMLTPGSYVSNRPVQNIIRGVGEFWDANTINAHITSPNEYINSLRCVIDSGTPCKSITIVVDKNFTLSQNTTFRLEYTVSAIVYTND